MQREPTATRVAVPRAAIGFDSLARWSVCIKGASRRSRGHCRTISALGHVPLARQVTWGRHTMRVYSRFSIPANCHISIPMFARYCVGGSAATLSSSFISARIRFHTPPYVRNLRPNVAPSIVTMRSYAPSCDSIYIAHRHYRSLITLRSHIYLPVTCPVSSPQHLFWYIRRH